MKSIGKRYFDELNLEAAKNFKDLRKIISRKISPEVANTIVMLITQRGNAADDGKNLEESRFYDYKNADYNRGMIVSAAFDGNIMVETCNWIHEHRNDFGKRILDVGCDTGIVSCFLARELPESHITAIDDGEAGIIIAKELANKLSLNNIDFRRVSVKDETHEYDTIFSSRVLHENLLNNKMPLYAPFREKCIYCASAIAPYLNQLRERIVDKGKLIAIERLATETSRVGYQMALSDNGLHIDKGFFGKLICNTVGESETFTTVIAVKDENKENCSGDEIINRTVDSWVDTFGMGYNHYPDETGEMLLHADGGKLIRGCYIADEKDIVAKNALYYSKTDHTRIYCVMDSEDSGRNLYVQDGSMIGDMIEQFDHSCKELKKQGVSVHKFKLGADGKEIIENFHKAKTGTTNKNIGKKKSKSKKKKKR